MINLPDQRRKIKKENSYHYRNKQKNKKIDGRNNISINNSNQLQVKPLPWPNETTPNNQQATLNRQHLRSTSARDRAEQTWDETLPATEFLSPETTTTEVPPGCYLTASSSNPSPTASLQQLTTTTCLMQRPESLDTFTTRI